MHESVFMSIPLALAAAISPSCFILFIRALSGKQHLRRNGLFFVAGAILANVAIMVVTLVTFGYALPVHHAQPHYFLRAVSDFVLAICALLMLLRMLLQQDKPSVKKADKKSGGKGVIGFLTTGFIFKLLEASNLPPFIGAVHIVREADLKFVPAFIAYFNVIWLSVLPLLLTYIMFVANENATLKVIAPIGNFIEKQKDRMIKVVLVLVVLLLVVHGAMNLRML